MSIKLENILKILKEKRGFDFSGYRTSMLERRIQKRIFATNCSDIDSYEKFAVNNVGELDKLIDVFTINVSRFFRNAIVFEYFNKFIIPDIIHRKEIEDNDSLRIWSAGCSNGEEPYSIAIIINEFLKKESPNLNVNIFGTDIDAVALRRAYLAIYNEKEISEVKFSIFRDYFIKRGVRFALTDEIKKTVNFSLHDLLDKKHMSPPESIYGSFDIVLCRNVLIYFKPEIQAGIFKSLYSSLNTNGYLILGESEVINYRFKNKFIKENQCCKIYKKIG